MSLLKLPDELLLMVVSHLPLIRPFDHNEPYIDAFQHCQEENEGRLAALAALCLTPKRLCNVATPELYSAITSYSGGSYVRLMGFLRTLIARPELQKDVKPIIWESDWRSEMQSTVSLHGFFPILAKEAARIWGADPEAHDLWSRIFSLNVPQGILAVIIALASNLEHLAILAVLHPGLEIIRLFNLGDATTESHLSQYAFKFPRLRDLVLGDQQDLFDEGMHLDEVQFLDPASICPSLRQIQMIGYARLAGTASVNKKIPLDNLHLCNSNTSSPAAFQISKCTALVRLHITWPVLWVDNSLPDIYEALLLHKTTLRSLTIEVGDSIPSYTFSVIDSDVQLGGFSNFNALRSLRIPSMLLLRSLPILNLAATEEDTWLMVNSGSHRISDLLPPTLEKLTLSEIFFLGTSTSVLHDLAHDKAKLPGLCSVELRSRLARSIHHFDLEQAFASHGVSFRISSPPPEIWDLEEE